MLIASVLGFFAHFLGFALQTVYRFFLISSKAVREKSQWKVNYWRTVVLLLTEEGEASNWRDESKRSGSSQNGCGS